ncbi:MAG: DUF2997 domain-containing protein [Caldilinea sp.]
MQNQEIEIAILPDGRVEYTIKGVKGAACEDISALLEQLGKVETAERTGEYYEDDTRVDVTVAG